MNKGDIVTCQNFIRILNLNERRIYKAKCTRVGIVTGYLFVQVGKMEDDAKLWIESPYHKYMEENK